MGSSIDRPHPTIPYLRVTNERYWQRRYFHHGLIGHLGKRRQRRKAAAIAARILGSVLD